MLLRMGNLRQQWITTPLQVSVAGGPMHPDILTSMLPEVIIFVLDAPHTLNLFLEAATPPLSPNTNSSPSYSSGPISPHALSIHHDRNKVASRSPSPSQHSHAEWNVISASRIPPTFPPDIPKTPETPLSTALSAKLPFFEKYKNKLPGGNIDLRSPQIAAPPSTASATGPPAASP